MTALSIRQWASRSGLTVTIVAFCFVSIAPLLWVIRMSLLRPIDLFASPPQVLPGNWTLESYRTIFTTGHFGRAVLNSLVVSGATTGFCLMLAALAAYAIARLHFRWRGGALTLILALTFFPGVAIIAPLFLQFRTLDIINTYWALIIPNTVFALPLTTWLLVAFFRDLPVELEDAAKVDGATPLRALRDVIVPLAAPGVFTAALLTFIFAWNEYLFANTFSYDDSVRPVTVVIPNYATQYSTDYGAQAAASVLVTLPLVVLVLIFQRRIVSGLTAGAVKG